MRLSVYHFKKNVSDFDDVWTDGPPVGYEQVELKGVPFSARAYVLANRDSVPAWVKYAAPHCPALSGIENQSSSFLLLIKSKGLIFAVCFGKAYLALDKDLCVGDFGLRVSMNTVAPTKLRSLQARNVDTTTVSHQLVVNRESSLSVFDIDLYQNLLGRLEGVPADERFGTRVAGSDACYITADVPFDSLAKKCDDLARYYRSRSYRKTELSVVDTLRPVSDATQIRNLDHALVEAIHATASQISFAIPDASRYDEIASYRLKLGGAEFDCPDLDATTLLPTLRSTGVTTASILDAQIWAVDAEGHELERFSVRRAIVCQIDLTEDTYVLTLGRWYRIARDYAARINDQLGQIRILKPGLLPDITETGKDAEGRYNERAAEASGFVLMDKKCIPIPGETRIEVCDLFSRRGEFIHVKRKTRSATLSHLLAQGSVSAKLFSLYREYRSWFRKKLPMKMRSLIQGDSVSARDFAVIYAITAPVSFSMPHDLPFFSKVNLLFHERATRARGYKVGVYHIQEGKGA